MEMLYYTVDGGRLAGLPGPAYMEWDFARLRKMGYGSTHVPFAILSRASHLSSTSSSPSHLYRFCFRFLATPFWRRYPTRIGRPIVASTRLWAIFASLWNLPHDWLSSNVQPLRPPHCGTSVVICAAYMCGFSG